MEDLLRLIQSKTNLSLQTLSKSLLAMIFMKTMQMIKKLFWFVLWIIIRWGSRTTRTHAIQIKRGNSVYHQTLSHHQWIQLQCGKIEPHLYVARCIHYNNGCQWCLRASYRKIIHHWEIKSIDGTHTCFSTLISQDHYNLDSTQIVSIVFHLVRTNPSIRIKSLVVDIKSRYGYTVTYRRAWIAKEKTITMEYGD